MALESGDNSKGSVLSCHAGSRDKTKVIRLFVPYISFLVGTLLTLGEVLKISLLHS